MNVDIVNLVIDLSFRVSVFYLLLKAIQDFRILKHYLYDADIKHGYDRLLLVVEVMLRILIYLCASYLISWYYDSFTISISIGGNTLVDLV